MIRHCAVVAKLHVRVFLAEPKHLTPTSYVNHSLVHISRILSIIMPTALSVIGAPQVGQNRESVSGSSVSISNPHLRHCHSYTSSISQPLFSSIINRTGSISPRYAFAILLSPCVSRTFFSHSSIVPSKHPQRTPMPPYTKPKKYVVRSQDPNPPHVHM